MSEFFFIISDLHVRSIVSRESDPRAFELSRPAANLGDVATSRSPTHAQSRPCTRTHTGVRGYSPGPRSCVRERSALQFWLRRGGGGREARRGGVAAGGAGGPRLSNRARQRRGCDGRTSCLRAARSLVYPRPRGASAPAAGGARSPN